MLHTNDSPQTKARLSRRKKTGKKLCWNISGSCHWVVGLWVIFFLFTFATFLSCTNIILTQKFFHLYTVKSYPLSSIFSKEWHKTQSNVKKNITKYDYIKMKTSVWHVCTCTSMANTKEKLEENWKNIPHRKRYKSVRKITIQNKELAKDTEK